ncbi:MAG TPA: PDZ domain-containing protein [Chthoniobacteraceae bacterium]|nr:PDZ domain-containing protein [Chthoniobacteraceae bacterium]
MLRLIAQKITMQNFRQFPAILVALMMAILPPSAGAALGTEQGAGKAPISPGSGREPRISSPITYLGVAIAEVAVVAPDLAVRLPIDPGTGLIVNEVLPDSPAARAGLQKGDVLIRLNGQVLVTPKQLQNIVQNRKPGDQVEMIYFRKSEVRKVTATLATRSVEMLPGDPRQRR